MQYLFKMLLALSAIIFGVCVSHVLGEDAPVHTNSGINACLSNPLFKNTIRYEVLPGMGWDNLENKNAGLLVDYSYSQCRTTDDGKYLLPDSVVTVPLKRSHLETYAEMFYHWSNYTDITARSINVGGEVQTTDFSISGKFSYQYQNVKMQQVSDKSVTTRVQARYVRYAAQLQPDTPLNPTFKKRLESIAANIQFNKTVMATYESQLLVRDFGTHFITTVDAGAIIGRLDQIKSSFTQNGDGAKSKILASASATFFDAFFTASLSAKYNQVTSKEYINQYLGNRTHSEIFSYGGPIYKPNNFSLDQWADDIGNNLIAVDRTGNPIYFLITRQSLPNLSPSILYMLTKYVKAAVESYYKFNVYKGCTKADSPNFSFSANVDDGSCESLSLNYNFGGVFQTCQIYQSGVKETVCSNLMQLNPLTGGFSCPENYEAVLIFQGNRFAQNSQRSCEYFVNQPINCQNIFASILAIYEAYWCIPRGSINQTSGFLFGGLYSNTISNLRTGRKSCPRFFYPLNIGENLKICVSSDFKLGFPYSVPFAGFYSCFNGNPLKAYQQSSTGSINWNVTSFFESQDNWPWGCPDGYSSNLASIVNNCEINYCVQAHAFTSHGFPPIRKPPYIDIPSDAFIYTGLQYDVQISQNYRTWTSVDENNAPVKNKAVVYIIAGILVVTEILK